MQMIDKFGCLNNTIKVAAGHYLDLVAPDPASIEIESIAAALSKICRFGGHCPKFYSVAEHCVHATAMACSDGYTGDALMAVFLHDAAEAYLGDMVKPLKVTMPQYREAEIRMESAIELAFGVDLDRWSGVIKRFDRAMLKAEKMNMWPEDKEKWSGFGEIEHREVQFKFWSHDDAKMQFLAMARTLQLAT